MFCTGRELLLEVVQVVQFFDLSKLDQFIKPFVNAIGNMFVSAPVVESASHDVDENAPRIEAVNQALFGVIEVDVQIVDMDFKSVAMNSKDVRKRASYDFRSSRERLAHSNARMFSGIPSFSDTSRFALRWAARNVFRMDVFIHIGAERIAN